jgi:hypothetical protein
MKNTTHSKFVELYNSVTKVISFVTEWSANGESLANAVSHLNYRLILEPGDRARCVDPLKRRVVFLGTPYGLIVLHETNHMDSPVKFQSVSFEVTKKLVKKEFFTRTYGVLPENQEALERITAPRYLELMAIVAQDKNDAGDDLPTFYKPRKTRHYKSKPPKAAPAAAKQPALKPPKPKAPKPKVKVEEVVDPEAAPDNCYALAP